jgi:hypothetical protein
MQQEPQAPRVQICRRVINEEFAEAADDANYLKIFIARRRVADLLVGDTIPA